MEIIPNGVLVIDTKSEKISFANKDMLHLADIKDTDDSGNIKAEEVCAFEQLKSKIMD